MGLNGKGDIGVNEVKTVLSWVWKGYNVFKWDERDFTGLS